jgi:ABC transporter with metal-binding/Fe-S-binding domain ATP-binding protein
MKAAALTSGGKDSVYAIYKAKQQGIDTVILISMKSKNPESYMFHIPNIHLVELQAAAMNLPLIFKETEGIKEEELKDLKEAIQEAKEKYQIESVISGALASEYQKTRVDKICEELDLKSIAPLWHVDAEEYMNELIENSFKVIITGVAAGGLTRKFLGKEITKELIEELKELRIHLAFEGGEAETFVVNCPLFSKEIKINQSEIHWDENTQSGHLQVLEASFI